MVSECPHVAMFSAIRVSILVFHIAIASRERVDIRFTRRREQISASVPHFWQTRCGDVVSTFNGKFSISRHCEVILLDIDILRNRAKITARIRYGIGTFHQDRASTRRGRIRIGDIQIGVGTIIGDAQIRPQLLQCGNGSGRHRHLAWDGASNQ